MPNVARMTRGELDALGEIVRDASAMYDALYDIAFPYMMCAHSAPTDGKSDEYYHFHIEFIPPMRSADKQQYFASSETGAGAWCNPTSPEAKAQELRTAYKKALTPDPCQKEEHINGNTRIHIPLRHI